jgi:hypothetical protein
VRRAGPLLLISSGAIAACSLFLDSGEFSSEDDARTDGGAGETSSSETGAGDGGVGVADDGGNDGGDDFCTRTFASTVLSTTFDLPVQSGWSRQYCEPYASLSQVTGDGNPAASLRVATDGGVEANSFRVCWLEQVVGAARIYRFGFDVRIESQSLVGSVAVARLELDTAPIAYGFSVYHGFGPSHVGHRFGFTDGGKVFQNDDTGGQATTGWTSYRVELVVESGKKGTYTMCRDGKKAYSGETDYALGASKSGLFDIGLTYVGEKQNGPIDIRFDNVFLDVAP